MKKKIVAFAVTAAMLVTNAVPVFAVGGWGETPVVENENPNVVIVDEKGISTDDVEGTVAGGVDFQTVVDLNGCEDKKAGNTLTLSLTFAQDKKVDLVLTKTNEAGNDPAQYSAKLGSGETVTGLYGICSFNWTVDEDGIEVVIYQYGKRMTSVGTLTADVPEDASGVIGLNAKASFGTHTMYVEYPQNVKSMQVVGEDGKAASQPVVGETYTVKSITLDHDTVISEKITKYVDITWYATKNGESKELTASNDGLTCKIPDNDTTKGAVISVTAKAIQSAGIEGEASWGKDSEAIAIADRIYGANRFQTALQVAEKIKAENGGIDAVVVANGDDFADALSGTALAKAEKAPILLVNKYNEAAVIEFIQDNLDYTDKVYILGGTGAVSAAFESAVVRYDEKRLGGANRYETNVAILKQIEVLDKADGVHNLLENIAVCSGLTYPDALSVSATGMPVLLVGSALTAEQDEFMKSINVNGNNLNDKYYIIGGTGAVSAAVESDLRSLDYVDNVALTGSAADVVRVSGENRYTTNKAVVEKFFAGNEKAAYIASGDEFADALTGGALAAINDKPLLLVNEYNTVEAGKIVNGNGYAMIVIGGTGAVSAKAVQDVYNTKVA